MELPLEELAKWLFDAITKKEWWAAVAGLLFLASRVLVTYGNRVPKLAPYLARPWVAGLLPIVLGAAGGVLHAAMAGGSLAAAMIAALKAVVLPAAIEFLKARKLLEVKAAGELAAATVRTEADAANVLRNSPPQ
jgi:hypothetical protein